MNFKNFTKATFIAVIFLTTNLNANELTKINFLKTKSFKTIQSIASQKNKPIFIEFHAHWCIPCRNMESEVFNNSTVAKYMNDHYVNYKVNIEKDNGPMLALALEIDKLPGMVIITPDGETISKRDTAFGKDKFLLWAKENYLLFKKPVVLNDYSYSQRKFSCNSIGEKDIKHKDELIIYYDKPKIPNEELIFKPIPL